MSERAAMPAATRAALMMRRWAAHPPGTRVMFASAGILLWGVSLWLAAIQRRREMSAG